MEVRILTLDPDFKFIDWIPTINLNPLECTHPNHHTRVPVYSEYF